MSNFAITCGKGFQMVFANGWTVSVQFGAGNYCDNRNDYNHQNESCANAEIAAWDSKGEWYNFPDHHDDVKGYCSTNEVVEFIHTISNLPPR
jgi:hypothetical protein